jgi:hypothetical protein
VYHRVQFEVYLKVCSEVHLRASYKLTWECADNQAESVPSSAIWRILESMSCSALENVLRELLGSILGVYLGVASECMPIRLGVYNGVQSGVYFGVYFAVCKEVHMAVLF